ncbi:hypothetical protein V5F76_05285, partial [Xanthobacter agilis]
GELRFTENALASCFIAISDAKPLHTFAEIALGIVSTEYVRRGGTLAKGKYTARKRTARVGHGSARALFDRIFLDFWNPS